MAGPVWRTDMFKTALLDERLKEAEFICASGPTVVVQADDLRRILPLGNDHYAGQIWGPFNIDPKARTVAGYLMPMTVTDEHQDQRCAC